MWLRLQAGGRDLCVLQHKQERPLNRRDRRHLGGRRCSGWRPCGLPLLVVPLQDQARRRLLQYHGAHPSDVLIAVLMAVSGRCDVDANAGGELSERRCNTMCHQAIQWVLPLLIV